MFYLVRVEKHFMVFGQAFEILVIVHCYVGFKVCWPGCVGSGHLMPPVKQRPRSIILPLESPGSTLGHFSQISIFFFSNEISLYNPGFIFVSVWQGSIYFTTLFHGVGFFTFQHELAHLYMWIQSL